MEDIALVDQLSSKYYF